ncbi:hypothetical protein BCL79_2735 [Stenotrophomonas rhizophila]|uniref:Uncharacterized protein n=1 Tax=Stenotrophomonas rhizophila TaxID=216778 RepID=A0A498CEW7_9GAMM|nr:hypothetical protein [Stenotrophomonas rhizophila]RLK53429.1 hypothetical protein BCL79_2735 [Stenotrophomonas rhizophila]
MKLVGNCLVVALAAKLIAPRRVRIRSMRNRAGRVHFMWEKDGVPYEFYTPGASRSSYLRNSLRVGEIRRVGGSR